MTKHGLHAFEIRGLHEIVARASAQRGDRAVDGGVTRDNDDFGRLGLFELAHELDALPSGRRRSVSSTSGRCRPSSMRASRKDCARATVKPFHASDFLQPFNDVRVVIDNQRVCHCFPVKPEAGATVMRARVSGKCLPCPTGTIDARAVRSRCK